ncbi:hypothetical protein GLAREA_09790 [Glarea lozoyensis ATCC 20868]|uniref:Uncharacterized protein n=1 Tax=Glarea lozoyensis (strain ATCC 20868 / MF5171) TaxID=1116229 RepID=S3CUI7_GLAL2|nr:uncharacterized protein GLAREA_09790 [Glarea lozoyensis ATCC 20868]EPE28669.1 hypothetical protein GLAREA_09790 [Glarea lozoyensis ATCC 20868]
MKERRLGPKKADLVKEESLLRKAKEEVDAADLVDDGKICVIQNRIWARESLERQERERAERQRMAKILKQQQEQRERAERERMTKILKQQQEQREKQEREAAEALKQQEEYEKKWKEMIDKAEKTRRQYARVNRSGLPLTGEGSTRQASTSSCVHNGWWSKVQGRTACPRCDEVWTYLLQCPGCRMKACPKCQAVVRPRIQRHAGRTHQTASPKVRTPSQDFFYDDYY